MKYEAVAFIWDGRAMTPLERFRPLCARQYRLGQEYALVPHQGRSDQSHRHYFACIHKGWMNLREEDAVRFPTSEHLRKWCLVQEGYADERSMICDNDVKARSTAELCRALDSFAVMKVNGPILTVWTAQSQDHHHMGHEAFQTSKTKVLERIADMIGVSLAELTKTPEDA